MLEIAGIVILGIVAQWVAWKFKLPAILPLILIGIIVGPIASLFTEDGSKLIEPVWNGEKGLFPGQGLNYFVSLAISVILFEGGLTLRRSEIRSVGPVITKLISLGVVVTFLAAGAAAHYIVGLSWPVSFLFSGLIVVTGPTVIAPILRNIPLKRDLTAVLKWEGILIDPIGALIAVLVFEFISVEGDQNFTLTALLEFGKILLFGITFGFTFGKALGFAIKKQAIPHYLLNVAALSAVLSVFVVSDLFAQESGLLAVVVMGLVLGNMKLPNLKELLYFKESLSVLLISILFILLAANINMADMLLIAHWESALLFAIVVFAIRPLAVFISTQGSSLTFREKLFISWMGPRGIVAAGVASLFGNKLIGIGEPGAAYVTPLVFMIVLGTVLLNATTARMVSKLLGVFLEKSEGVLIIGASLPSRLIGQYLQRNNRHVVMVDNNTNNVDKAEAQGLEAITTNIYTDNLSDHVELSDVGYLLALTGNSEINRHAISAYRHQFGENGTYRLVNADELGDLENIPKEGLFTLSDDYIALNEAARRDPAVREIELRDIGHLQRLLERIGADGDRVPLFLKDPSGELYIIPSHILGIDQIGHGYQLVYLGRPLDPIPVEGSAKFA